MAGGCWPLPRDAVPVALAILDDATPDVTGFGEMPTERPPRFYVVSRIGGEQKNPKFDTARILVECWAEDAADAADVARYARQGFRNSAGRFFGAAFIYGWDNEQGPVDFNDPDIQDRRRCQFFGDLSISCG